MKKSINRNSNVKFISIYIYIYILFCLFSDIYLVQKFADLNKIDYFTTNIFIILLFITIIQIIGLLVIKIFKDKKHGIQYIYLAFSVVFGIIYLFAFPISQIPDEKSDYARTLEITEGHLISEKIKTSVGRKLSTNIKKVYSLDGVKNKYTTIKKIKNIKLNNNKVFIDFANKSLYAFVCYIPQVIGVGIGKILNLSIYYQILLGKICNYILFVTLMFLALKIIPVKKELVFLIAMLPICMQEAMSLSPDAMIIAVSVLFVSYILYLRINKKENINKKDLFYLSILAITLSLCKIVYLPLCLLLFLIPNERFVSKKSKYIFIGILAIICAGINLLWLSISSKYLVAFIGISNSSLQLKYVLNNLLKYIVIIFSTLDVFLFDYFISMVGGSLGLLNIKTSSIMTFCTILILVYLIGIPKKGKRKFNNKELALIIFIIFSTILLIFTSLYLQWTSVGNDKINGVQGRYFIPLILCIASLFIKDDKLSININKYFMMFTYFLNIMAITAVIICFI